MEQEEKNVRLAMLGYMFTFNGHRLWQLLGEITQELRQEFVKFGLRHLPRSIDCVIKASDFEKMYFDDIQAAHAWQEM